VRTAMGKARDVNNRFSRLASPSEEPACVPAHGVFKRKGRWYARLGCPKCSSALRVRLSLGPMVARCEVCAIDVEADVRRVLREGRA
jgi:hypothetical protein